MATRNIVPRATGQGSLGTSSKAWGEVHAGKHFGFGCLPLGSIIAWIPSTFTGAGNTGPLVGDITGGGQKAYLATFGMAKCDGELVSSHIAGANFASTSYMPELTDNRFLQGSDGTGGADSVGTAGGTSAGSNHTHSFVIPRNGYSSQDAWEGTGYISLTSPAYIRHMGVDRSLTTGTAASSENRPKYLAVHYIMRII